MSDNESPDAPESAALLEPCFNCGATLDVTDRDPLDEVVCEACDTKITVRTHLKNYLLDAILGGGGMGTVYRALDLDLNRYIALKVVRREFSANEEHLRKFEDEARVTALVTHPNVVKVFSFGSEHGIFFIAMELVDKGTLDHLMRLQGRIAEAQVLEIGIQIAGGLSAAFDRGLIHRDVKPGNILFAGPHLAKIVDFGLARLIEQGADGGEKVWGTPYYVSPERINREPEDFRSDIYSLGATLFHAIAGRPPHEAETVSQIALKHIKNQSVGLQAFAPDVSKATALAINRMLQLDPNGRQSSYAELIEQLVYARDSLNDRMENPGQPQAVVILKSEQQENKLAAWLTISMVGVVLLLVVVWLIIFRDKIFR